MPSIPVLSKDGRPLMPCHHYGRVKRWLKQGKAVIRSRWPFAVQLRYDVEMESSEGAILGLDPGRTNIGLCAIDRQGRVLFSADCQTRSKEVRIVEHHVPVSERHASASRQDFILKARSRRRGAGCRAVRNSCVARSSAIRKQSSPTACGLPAGLRRRRITCSQRT